MLQAASLLKTGDTWRAQARRKGHNSIAETFPTKAQAAAWARKIEAEIGARRVNDARELAAHLTLKEWRSIICLARTGQSPVGVN
ncbi:hypothetical protein GCM10027320_41730 [Massilia solisilvae]